MILYFILREIIYNKIEEISIEEVKPIGNTNGHQINNLNMNQKGVKLIIIVNQIRNQNKITH
jgi:hypothetical protein